MNGRDEADMELIKNSCTMLYSRTLELGLKNILMPKIGSGLGKLNWEDVKTVITPILDDRFTVCFLE
jgi:O-acetyl-ADP-ribose deacetylase (regulator of RNase III)